MQAVKDVLNRKKVPDGYPPHMMDVKTREKHVPESVDYNIKHFGDHGKNVAEQLRKLHMVNPAKAHSYAAKSLAEIRKHSAEMESRIEGSCKECNK